MLLWLHKKERQLKLKVVGLVLFLHSSLIGILFHSFYQEHPRLIHIDALTVPVLFMPFAPTLSKDAMTKSMRMASASVSQKKVPVVVPSKQKATSKSAIPKPKKLPAPTKKQITESKKLLQSVVPKKIQSPQKPPKPKKMTKILEKKEKIIMPEKEIKKEVAAQPQPQLQQQENIQQEFDQIQEQALEPIMVGREDYDTIMAVRRIQESIRKQWRPPVGVSADSGCLVRVAIAKDGKINQIIIEKSSGILVYDLAARDAIAKVSFGREQWGKELLLLFGKGN